MTKNNIYITLTLIVSTSQLFGAAAQPQAAVVSDLYNRIFSKKLPDAQAIKLIEETLVKKELTDINAVGKNNINLLHAAAWNDRPHLISYLLNIGADPSIEGGNGTALDIAREQNNLEIIQLLEQKIATSTQSSQAKLEQVPQPEVPKVTSPTLHKPETEVVSNFINNILPNLDDTQATNALQEALTSGSLKNVNTPATNSSLNLLHWASYRGYPSLVTLLIAKGADPLIKNPGGKNAFEIAESANKPEILALLEQKFGPQAPKKPETNGNAPLQADVVNELIVKLTKGGANDATALTAIRKAIEDGELADVNIPRNDKGMNLLHWAADRGFTGVTTYLLEQGANPALETISGMTALDIAKTNKKTAVAKLLTPTTSQTNKSRKPKPTGHVQVVLEHANQGITLQNMRAVWKELTAGNRQLTVDEIKQLITYATDPDQTTNREKNRLWVLANNLIAANPTAIDPVKAKLDPTFVDTWYAIIARKQRR
jgi:ankyrin repeat protein